MQVMVQQMASRDAEQARRDEKLAAEQARRDEKNAAELAAELARRDEKLAAERAVERAAERASLNALLHSALAVRSLPTITSAASVGASVHTALQLHEKIVVFSPPPDGATDADTAPVVAVTDLERLRACATEAALVATAMPALCTARRIGGSGAVSDPCALVLVNSMRSPWLDSLHGLARPPAQRLKPDLFMTWAPCWKGTARGGPAGNVGVLANRVLQRDGCVREFYEAKRGNGELTIEDFGQLADYHTFAPGLCRGMLFNARDFWLYETFDGLPLRLIKAALGARGSLALLRGFFDDAVRPVRDPPLICVLRALMRNLKVVPCEVEPGAGSFLGAGASGRAFAVRYAEVPPPGAPPGAPMALKASPSASRAELLYEFEQLQAAAAAGAPVVPVVAGSLHLLTGDDGYEIGGGYLLRNVLEPFAVTSAARCTAAFASLRALHAKGFAHGDARLPNLLATGARSEPVWIDMRAAVQGVLPVAKRAVDAETLAASILVIKVGDLPRPIAAAAAAYATAMPGAGDHAALAAAVFAAAGPPVASAGPLDILS